MPDIDYSPTHDTPRTLLARLTEAHTLQAAVTSNIGRLLEQMARCEAIDLLVPGAFTHGPASALWLAQDRSNDLAAALDHAQMTGLITPAEQKHWGCTLVITASDGSKSEHMFDEVPMILGGGEHLPASLKEEIYREQQRAGRPV